jgi:hypothetical protein
MSSSYDRRILVHPLRKDVDHFTFYLMVADSLPPYGWNRNTFFKLVLINQLDKKKSIIKGTNPDLHFLLYQFCHLYNVKVH